MRRFFKFKWVVILVTILVLLMLSIDGYFLSKIRNIFHSDYIATGIIKVEAKSLEAQLIPLRVSYSESVGYSLKNVQNKPQFRDKYPQIESISQDGWSPDSILAPNISGEVLVYDTYPPTGKEVSVAVYGKHKAKNTYQVHSFLESVSRVRQFCNWLNEDKFLCQIRTKTGDYRKDLKIKRYNYLVDKNSGFVSSVGEGILSQNRNIFDVELRAPYFLLDTSDRKGVNLLLKDNLELYKTIMLPEGDGLLGHSNDPQSCRFWGQKDIVCYVNLSGNVYLYNLDTSIWKFRDDFDFSFKFSAASPYLFSKKCLYGWGYFLDMSGYWECERMAFYVEKKDGKKITIMDIKRKKNEHFQGKMLSTDGEKYFVKIKSSKRSTRPEGGVRAYYIIDLEKLQI